MLHLQTSQYTFNFVVLLNKSVLSCRYMKNVTDSDNPLFISICKVDRMRKICDQGGGDTEKHKSNDVVVLIDGVTRPSYRQFLGYQSRESRRDTCGKQARVNKPRRLAVKPRVGNEIIMRGDGEGPFANAPRRLAS